MASAPNPDFGWVRVEVLRFNSTYVDASSISQFRSNKNLTFDGNETNVICEPCTKDELVCWGQQRVGSPQYTYMYETLFSKLRVRLPFSPFECHVLRSLNVAPTQLHPNSWGFVRCFEILCRSLGMKASVGRFFYFFEAKLGKEVGWLSLNSTPRRGIMTALMGSYKDFKDKFFRVRAAEHFPELFFGPNSARKFPLYWTLDPVPICGADRKLMSSEEQADVDVLERFRPLSCSKLLQLEHNTKGLQEYLVRMSPMSAEDLRVYFEKASKSKRKASPEAAANDSSVTHSSSSLIVRKVRKRCETEEDTGGVEIKGEQTQNSDDIEDKWRSFLKDFDGSGQGEIESLLDKRFPMPDLSNGFPVSSCRAIQAFAVRSAFLARTMEDEFDRVERDKVKMEKELERLMKKVAELEEEKSQWVAWEKNLKAEKEKIENEKLRLYLP